MADYRLLCYGHAIVDGCDLVGAPFRCLDREGRARQPIRTKADPRRMPSRGSLGRRVAHWLDDDSVQ